MLSNKKILLGCLILVMAVLTGCSPKKNTAVVNDNSVVGIPINTAKARTGEISDKIHLMGTVYPYEQNLVYSKASGRLVKNTVEEGNLVNKDDVVAYVDRDEPGYDFTESPVKSPAKGVVLKRFLDVGATVSPAAGSVSMATPIISIGDISKVKIYVNVVEADIGRVKLNQNAEVRLEAYPDRIFVGKITNISPTADSMNHSSKLEVLVDNSDNLIKPGLSADVDLVVGGRSNVVMIPRNALIRKAGEIYVFVIENNVAAKRIVEPGFDDGVNLQIKKGVKAGDIIANSDFNILQDGLKVKAE